MELPRNYIRKYHGCRAFTLLEVLFVIAIFTGVLAGTLSVTAGMYQSEIVRTERIVITQLLQTARSDAQHGQFGVAHGVAFNPPGFVGYVTFAGDTLLDSAIETRQYIPQAPSVLFASNTPTEVVFALLSGETNAPSTIILFDRNRELSSSTIHINETGYVGW